MRTLLVLMTLILLGELKTFGQEYSLYSNEKLLFESKYLGENIALNLHLPDTHNFSAATTKYPISIIFDSQHERTYPQIISSFDLLTSETQIPESIIIGVPFNMQNRRYLTSEQKIGNDTLSGIKRMELFLFEELLPQLQNKYKGNEFVSLIGHSRTAFLVNYLSFRRPNQVNVAVSLSGFFNDEPLSKELFHSFLTNNKNFPNKFYYYYTSGTTLEESTYLVQFKYLDSVLKKSQLPENVKIKFSETKNANHITNYWVSVPHILIDVFSEYNSILDNWFHNKLEIENADKSIQQFQKDLEQASVTIGTTLNPNLTHIYSLASFFANKEDYQTAIDFIELGLKYYPNYLELYIDVIDFNKVIKNQEKVSFYKNILREKTTKSTHLSKSEKGEIFEYLDKE
jgi:enterochelin esterase-like enzyme